MNQYIIPFIFLFLGSCAHQHPQINPGLNFEFINSIPLGTHSTVIKQSLGEPTSVNNEGDNTLAWYYALGSYNKLALLFDSTSMKILSKFWN